MNISVEKPMELFLSYKLLEKKRENFLSTQISWNILKYVSIPSFSIPIC